MFGGVNYVSINSTSEEVRRNNDTIRREVAKRFPLIQLPRKSEEMKANLFLLDKQFPLIQLPRKSEEKAISVTGKRK